MQRYLHQIRFRDLRLISWLFYYFFFLFDTRSKSSVVLTCNQMHFIFFWLCNNYNDNTNTIRTFGTLISRQTSHCWNKYPPRHNYLIHRFIRSQRRLNVQLYHHHHLFPLPLATIQYCINTHTYTHTRTSVYTIRLNTPTREIRCWLTYARALIHLTAVTFHFGPHKELPQIWLLPPPPPCKQNQSAPPSPPSLSPASSVRRA